MHITMYTNILLIRAIGLGSYAVLAKEGGRMFRHAKVFHTPIFDLNIAEICGVINGLAHVLNTIKPTTGSKIIAETKSRIAVDVLTGINRDPLFDAVVKSRNRLLGDKGITVVYAHTNLHKHMVTPRNNGWCDTACREALRIHQAIKSLSDSR